ncbi:MAG TPA: RDD family protein [Acidocella sp.]|nr:RDD family protein [Acidocella sp.]HQU05256.1 RDD family protein [Acidocella sp.]
MSQTLINPSEAAMFQGVLARRLCAFAVDLMMMTVLGWVVATNIFIFGLFTFGLGFFMFHVMPFFPLVYYTLLVATGGTLGQRMFGLSVRQDIDLSPPSPAQALAWTVLLWLSFFVFACLPFAMALVGARHRAGHDLFSGLVIIRNR